MKPKKKVKKRPQDATMRNVRAVDKRIEYIEGMIRGLFMQLLEIVDRLEKLERKAKK